MSYIDELVAKGYGGYRGWGEAEARADFTATGGSGKWDPSVRPSTTNLSPRTDYLAPTMPSISGINPAQVAQQILEMQKTANQPAIQTLQSQQDPLKARYDSVITDIKAKQGIAVQNTQIATAQEFGRRGIPLSSGAYDVALSRAVNPVNVQFGGLTTQAESQKSTDLLNLAKEIASLQGGNIPQALQLAQGLIGLQQKADELAADKTNKYTTIPEGSTLYNLLTGKPLYTTPKTFAPSAYSNTMGNNDPLGLGF